MERECLHSGFVEDKGYGGGGGDKWCIRLQSCSQIVILNKPTHSPSRRPTNSITALEGKEQCQCIEGIVSGYETFCDYYDNKHQ